MTRWSPAEVPGTLCGVLRKPGRPDVFKLQLQKNQRIFVRGEARALSSPADLELTVVDRTGRELRRAGENTQTREEASLGMREQTYGWNLEMQMRAAKKGLRIREIPVDHRCRTGGLSKVSGTFRGTFVAGTRILATLLRVALEKS